VEIRNFCIIAHVDHGKSTLADRFIEITGTVPKRQMREQMLDQMDLERERGITIKLQPVRMCYDKGTEAAEGTNGAEVRRYQLNLIDTPGHMDFRYEVSRSLAAVEGAILLVDATQGVQAQTISTLRAAEQQGLAIIPVVNKIDLPAADVEHTTLEICHLLSCQKEDVLAVSAKEGTGMERLLEAVISRVPSPFSASSASFASSLSSDLSFEARRAKGEAPPRAKEGASSSKALIFDAVADPYRGIVAYVRVSEGELRSGMKLHLLNAKRSFMPMEVGSFDPKFHPEAALSMGEIGYVVTGLKNLRDVRVGDTVSADIASPPLPGYQALCPMVFAGLYPVDTKDTVALREALEKLQLNDAALVIEPDRNAALGSGFRCGFLGLLHMEIVQERLEREHGCSLVITAPTVQYEVKLRARLAAPVVRSNLLDASRGVAVISNPADFPDPTYIEEIREPWVALEVVAPSDRVGVVMELIKGRRGVYLSHDYLDQKTAVLHFEVPLKSIVLDFFDRLKSVTAGYGSMSYAPLGFRAGELVKLDILLLSEPVEALSTIVHRREAYGIGADICRRLKEVIPKAQFSIPIQAAVGGKIVARETIPALRKDVTAPLYGGDVTRKRKLLEKQKKGKQRLKQMGRVTLTQEAFLSVLQRGS
jgi:GTP-binding protein LepA